MRKQGSNAGQVLNALRKLTA
ncbi:MAG: hypothetical protein QG618_707, partial [Thermodesulfobacteriota bacterium]|nr:hypothetical protein [Thermodesulfobacteriota bacterium]